MKTSISCSLLLLLSTAPAIAQTPSAAPSRPASQPVGTSGPTTTAPPKPTAPPATPSTTPAVPSTTPAVPSTTPAAPSTTAPATPAATTTRTAATSADYRLVPGDKLRIEVYKDPQLSQSVQIRPDGKITLPLANDVTAAGQTPNELRDAIVTSLKPYMSNPTVTVMVVETVPPLIYVMGEVNSAGPQPLVGKMDVLQALSAAKGFRDFADTKNIVIRRGSQVLTFNYNDGIKGKAAPVFLQPGDTIVVK
jgi:polysaccharide export outer membrane protein